MRLSDFHYWTPLTVKAKGGVPLIATAVWLDLPGYVELPQKDPLGKRATVNANLSVLKNDIDVKVTRSGNTWYPPSLRPYSDSAWDWTQPASYAAPNRRDTVEKIIIPQPIAPTGSPLKAMPAASQVYTITYNAAVTLRNELGQAAPQQLAIVLSGIQPEGTPDFRILWFEETGDNEVTLLWPSVPGATYWVQYSDTLASSSWIDVAGSNVIASNSYVARSVSKNPSGSHRFYRIRRVL